LPIRRGHARVLFNEGAFAEDTMRSGRAGADALREARGQFEQEGVEIKTLRRCDPEGRDGTKLPACFKDYLPAPNGKFGWSSDSSEIAKVLHFAISLSAFDITLATPMRRPSTRSRTGVSTASCHRSLVSV
jgi:hypothetical protein